MSNPEKSMRPVRTAVIGYGLAGRVFHCPFISAVPGLELATIVQRHGDEARAAYPAAHIARTVDEVLNDSSIELITVATPNETHFELAKQVLSAGKHCVVDKPFAATSQQAAELISLSKAKGRLIVPFHNRRFDGDFLTVQELIREQTLGRIVEISSRFDRFRPTLRQNSWKEQSGPMNGMLFDLGPHLFDQALALYGAPNTINASIYKDRTGTAVDDAFELVLTYEDLGLRYRCAAGMLAADPAPRFRVNGTHGSYTKYGVDPQEATVGAGARPPAIGAAEPWLPEPQSAWGTLTTVEGKSVPAKLRAAPYPTLTGDYRHFYENVRDAIHGSAELIVRPADGYHCIRLLELALQSHEEGRSIRVDFEF